MEYLLTWLQLNSWTGVWLVCAPIGCTAAWCPLQYTTGWNSSFAWARKREWSCPAAIVHTQPSSHTYRRKAHSKQMIYTGYICTYTYNSYCYIRHLSLPLFCTQCPDQAPAVLMDISVEEQESVWSECFSQPGCNVKPLINSGWHPNCCNIYWLGLLRYLDILSHKCGLFPYMYIDCLLWDTIFLCTFI